MIHLSNMRHPVGAAFALLLLLSACGADSAETNTPEPSPQNTEYSHTVIEPSASPVESDPSEPGSVEIEKAGDEPVVTDPVEESPEPSGPVVLDEIVGRIPLCETVDESWFADAVFIGDSRTEGLELYGGIKGASYLAYKGLSVFSIDEKECIALDGKKVTVLNALSRKTYGKVFIMLGINELGYQNMNAFKQAYTDLVQNVRTLQPEADIYIQLQPPANETVAKQKGSYTNVTNERIRLFNSIIAEVAEEQQTALLDIWEALADENDVLPADITADGVHMVRAGYQIWADYLRTHTGSTPLVTEES